MLANRYAFPRNDVRASKIKTIRDKFRRWLSKDCRYNRHQYDLLCSKLNRPEYSIRISNCGNVPWTKGAFIRTTFEYLSNSPSRLAPRTIHINNLPSPPQDLDVNTREPRSQIEYTIHSPETIVATRRDMLMNNQTLLVFESSNFQSRLAHVQLVGH